MKFPLSAILMMVIHITVSAQNNPSLSVSYESGKKSIRIRWQHTDERISSYIVQRSSDNIFYTDIYTKKTTDTDNGEIMKFTDNTIANSKNYYRLKIYRASSSYEATLPVMVIPANTENKWVLYPVPIGPILNLQYTGNGIIKGVITVLIQSVSSGTVFTRLRLASNTKTIQIPITHAAIVFATEPSGTK